MFAKTHFVSPLIIALTCAAIVSANAQTTTPPADPKLAEPAPSATPIYSIWGFDLTGHFDVGYTHLSGSGKFVSGVNDRVFDFKRNGAAIHAVDLQLAKLPENGFGGLVNVTLGKDADTIASYGMISRTKGPANGADHYADLTQGYVHFGAAPFTVIAGKFVTLAGAEVIKSPADVNYSRSILFGYAIPFTHTGVRASYKLNDMLSLTAGVNQGWDQFKDTNNDKTVELGAAFAPSKAVTVLGVFYTGKENVAAYPSISGEKGTRNLLDLVATFSATEQLTFVINYDYGTQESAVAGVDKAKWHGVAGYANYQINDLWRTSLRGEYFNDRDGYRTGVAQKWTEGTLTLAYLPTKALEVRAEVRRDHSDKLAFLKSDGSTPTDKQWSLGLELLFKF